MTLTELKIVNYIIAKGPVSVEDIQTQFGIASLKSVHVHISNIRKKGRVINSSRKHRPHLGRKRGEYYWINS